MKNKTTNSRHVTRKQKFKKSKELGQIKAKLKPLVKIFIGSSVHLILHLLKTFVRKKSLFKKQIVGPIRKKFESKFFLWFKYCFDPNGFDNFSLIDLFVLALLLQVASWFSTPLVEVSSQFSLPASYARNPWWFTSPTTFQQEIGLDDVINPKKHGKYIWSIIETILMQWNVWHN